MRRTLTLQVDGAKVEFDSVWRGHERLRPSPPPREMPRFCPECWHPLPPGGPAGTAPGSGARNGFRGCVAFPPLLLALPVLIWLAARAQR